MRKGFVITANYRRLKEAQLAVERRGAAEAGLVIIRGPFGVGKSTIVERWAVDARAVFVRAKETWTKRALLNELADQMGLDSRGSNSEVQARVIGSLAQSMQPLVFDEADHLIRTTPSLLETIRDITDVTGCACFLVGMPQFTTRLGRYGHIASRVAKVVEFEMLDLPDVQAICTAMCEVKLSPDVVISVAAQSSGRARLILTAISNLEAWAAANGWEEITKDHIKGRTLVVEFKPGQVAK